MNSGLVKTGNTKQSPPSVHGPESVYALRMQLPRNDADLSLYFFTDPEREDMSVLGSVNVSFKGGVDPIRREVVGINVTRSSLPELRMALQRALNKSGLTDSTKLLRELSDVLQGLAVNHNTKVFKPVRSEFRSAVYGCGDRQVRVLWYEKNSNVACAIVGSKILLFEPIPDIEFRRVLHNLPERLRESPDVLPADLTREVLVRYLGPYGHASAGRPKYLEVLPPSDSSSIHLAQSKIENTWEALKETVRYLRHPSGFLALGRALVQNLHDPKVNRDRAFSGRDSGSAGGYLVHTVSRAYVAGLCLAFFGASAVGFHLQKSFGPGVGVLASAVADYVIQTSLFLGIWLAEHQGFYFDSRRPSHASIFKRAGDERLHKLKGMLRADLAVCGLIYCSSSLFALATKAIFPATAPYLSYAFQLSNLVLYGLLATRNVMWWARNLKTDYSNYLKDERATSFSNNKRKLWDKVCSNIALHSSTIEKGIFAVGVILGAYRVGDYFRILIEGLS